MDQEQSLTQKTFKGLFWMFSGKGTQAILQFIVLIVLARLLSPSDFGVVSAATVIITFTTVFSMIGVGPAIIQRQKLNESHIRTGFTMTVLLSVFFGVLLYFGSSVIAIFFDMVELKKVLQVMSVIFLFKSFSIISESLVQRELRFRLFVNIEIISYVIYALVGVLGASFGLGYWALVFAIISQEFLKTLLLILLVRHNMKPQLHWNSFKDLFFFGGGFTIGRLGNQFALQADNLVVGRWLGADSLGLYSRAYQLMVMPANLFGQVLDRVLFPAMARIQKEKHKLSYVYRIGITSIAFITIPLSLFICLLSKDIVILLFGYKWLNLVPALQVLSIGLVFRTGYKISDSLARATGAVYHRAWRQIIHAIAVFFGALIGQNWGIVGVSFGILGAIIINYGLMTHLSLKYISLSLNDIIYAHVPGFFLGVIVVLDVLAINWISIAIPMPPIIKIMLSGIIFVISVIILVKLNMERFLGRDVLWIKNQIMVIINKRKRRNV